MDDNLIQAERQKLENEFQTSFQLSLENLVREERTRQWNLFLEQKGRLWAKQIQELPLVLPNAKNNTLYHETVTIDLPLIALKSVEFLSDNTYELLLTEIQQQQFSIDGTPNVPVENTPATLKMKIEFCNLAYPNINLPSREMLVVVNADPKQLWKNLPVPDDIEYPKVDQECDYISQTTTAQTKPEKETSAPETKLKMDKSIIAASKRGRSHAHKAKPRDDHYAINITEEGWYVAIVADGAGSALFSREGSRVACETAERVIINELQKAFQLKANLLLIDDLNSPMQINKTDMHKEIKTKDLQKAIGDGLYNILGKAALEVHKQIKEVATAKQRKPKDYATTLLIALCKHYENGWFIASFWIGDGAIAVYDKTNNSVKLLCCPDEGEFSGQTRFVTMPEIFSSAKNIYFFETDANLTNPQKWDELLQNINLSLKGEENQLPDEKTQAQRLMQWLDFWSPGNHDDRTIVIVH